MCSSKARAANDGLYFQGRLPGFASRARGANLRLLGHRQMFQNISVRRGRVTIGRSVKVSRWRVSVQKLRWANRGREFAAWLAVCKGSYHVD